MVMSGCLEVQALLCSGKTSLLLVVHHGSWNIILGNYFFHIHLRQRTWRLLSCLTCQIWTLLDTLDALDTLDTLDTHALKWCLTGTCIMVIAVMGKFGKPTFCGSVQLGNWSILTLSPYWSQPFDVWYGQMQPLWWEKSEKESEGKE